MHFPCYNRLIVLSSKNFLPFNNQEFSCQKNAFGFYALQSIKLGKRLGNETPCNTAVSASAFSWMRSIR